jgi:outer membrane assembly lipoprotein YfiO
MTMTASNRALALAATLALLVSAGACAARSNKIPEGTNEPDKFLFEKGNEALANKKWLSAREFYQTLMDTYPQSPHRADAKLGLADSYLGDGSLASQVLALNEYREFLSFYPTHARADYAQYKTAMAHYYQMAKAGRDQSETKQAIAEFDNFFQRYPNSALVGDAKKYYREALDRRGLSEFGIGLTYVRIRWYPGAENRFKELLKVDPQFTNRDGVYFYLAEALAKLNRQAEALPYLERLIAEFQQSEYLEDAQKRIAELKAAIASAAAAPKAF